jgi:hypothetical protein
MFAPSQERNPHSAPAAKRAPVRRQTNRAPDIRAAGNLSVQRLSLQECGGHKCPPSCCSPARKRRIEGHSREDPLGDIPAAVFGVLKSSGHPMDGRTRAAMESVFGHDLRGVRIHSDSVAAASADEVGALAYTVGSNIVLGRGQTDRSVSGAEVLAHELAHVFQQRRGASGGGTSLTIDDNPAREAEADQWARRARKAVAHVPPPRSHATEHRCPRDQGCSAEDLVDHQGHGTTTCNQATGAMNVNVTEHCAGDCVARHEAVHVGDRQTCCTRASACLTAAGGDATRAAACRAAYNTWHPQLSDWTECRAYTTEVGCLTSFIAANCGAGGATSAACCTTLRGELRFARGEVASRCPGVNQACPFAADGSII